MNAVTLWCRCDVGAMRLRFGAMTPWRCDDELLIPKAVSRSRYPESSGPIFADEADRASKRARRAHAARQLRRQKRAVLLERWRESGAVGVVQLLCTARELCTDVDCVCTEQRNAREVEAASAQPARWLALELQANLCDM